MSLHPILEAAAATPFGGRRFYEPGQHPATHRLRQHLEALRKLPPSLDRNAALEYAKTQIAAFEEGESIAKADHLRMVQGHL